MSTVSAAPEAPALLDVRAVAQMLNCSPRHVYRMADSGALPRPLKVGALVRWSRQAITAWIEAGCQPVRENRR